MSAMIKNSTALAAMAASMPKAVVAGPRADATGDVAKLLGEVKALAEETRDKLFPKAEQALKEAEAAKGVGADLKASIDELLPKFNELQSARAKLEGTLEALESRTLDVEQVLAEGASGRKGARVSAGKMIAESDELKAYHVNGRSGAFEITVNATVTSADGSGGGMSWSEREPAPVNMPRRQLLIRDLLNVVPTASSVREYTRQTLRDNAAAPVAEQGTAPESDYGWTKQSVTMRKLSHVTHISEEVLSDASELEAEINGELAYGLDLVEETQILSGDGLGENLSGLITNATAFSAAAGLPNATAIDRLRLAILQVTLADYAADAIVLNPTDWAGIELLKDGESRFLFGVPANPGAPALWRLPVVESNTMTANEWLVGSMRMAATLYDRMQTTLRISSEHATNFVDGMLTMKGTKRVGLAVKRPASLVTGNFTFI